MDTLALKAKTCCRIFGFTVVSDMKLPELPPSVLREPNVPDIYIGQGELSWNHNELTAGYEYFSVRKDELMIFVPEIALFSIRGGSTITYMPIGQEDGQKIRLYLLGTCMGVLLLQRGILPLHGSAVVIDGKAYAFVGESGAGKSTLAAAFRHKGYSLLSDDIIAVTMEPGLKNAVVLPSFPQQKLWESSLTGLGMESGQYNRLVHEADKYAVPVGDQFMTQPVPLAGVFELAPSDTDGMELYPAEGLERLQLLFRHTYRQFLIPRLQRMQWHLDISAQLAGQCSIYQLRRPYSTFSVYALTEEIIRVIGKGEQVRDVDRIYT